MPQFLKYILRGCVGGAVLPLLWFVCIFGPFGPLVFVYLPSTVEYLLGPGALVGLVVWLCSLVFEHLGWAARALIGSALLSVIVLVRIFLSLPNGSVPPHFGQTLVWIVLNVALIGALSGLTCPSGTQATREAKLSYWERVAMYEIVELEARLSRTNRETKGRTSS